MPRSRQPPPPAGIPSKSSAGAAPGRESGRAASARQTTAASAGGGTTVKLVVPLVWSLRVIDRDGERRVPLSATGARIGRREGVEIAFPVAWRTISREHARIEWNGGAPLLIHLSAKNPTFLNGETAVRDKPRPLHAGDRIELPEGVLLIVETPAPGAAAGVSSAQVGLAESMEQLSRREHEIEQRFGVTGSFLDVDVAGSSALKACAVKASALIVSFERWRAWVAAIVAEFDGRVLNSNGDELMCYFPTALAGVRGGTAILERLSHFNASENCLPRPFRLRIGIHYGRSLVDLDRGRAYSQVLDGAGHLQKGAPVDGLLISEAVLRELPPGLAFEPAGQIQPEGFQAYRLVPSQTPGHSE